MTKPTSTSGSESGAPIAITVGEPAGIGPDLCLSLAAKGTANTVFVGDPEQLARRARLLSIDVEIVSEGAEAPGRMHVLPIDLANKTVCGLPDPANAAAILRGLDMAVDGCRDGRFAAMTTGPMQKSTINEAGIAFSGHTEYIAGAFEKHHPVMLLVAGELRVALVTTHIPLRRVPDAINGGAIVRTASIVNDGLSGLFGIQSPSILICGLNPHAGEAGHLGSEDDEIIAPAVETLRRQGVDARGPVPADTAFTPMAGKSDAIIAMYHDQGLPALKYAGFGNAVNVTLGLPIVRTSVDHGTALSLAGTGEADDGSLISAIDLARQLTAR